MKWPAASILIAFFALLAIMSWSERAYPYTLADVVADVEWRQQTSAMLLNATQNKQERSHERKE